MRISARQYVEEGCMLPRGYGIAWRELYADRLVAYPMPLHVLASWARWAWFWFKGWHAPDPLNEAFHRGHGNGYESGYESGYASGRAEVRRAEERGMLMVVRILRDEHPKAADALMNRIDAARGLMAVERFNAEQRG